MATTFVSRKTNVPATQGYTYGKAPSASKTKTKARTKVKAYGKVAQPKSKKGKVKIQQQQPPPEEVEEDTEQQEGVDEKKGGWTAEQLAEAKANSEDIFQTGLREDMSRQVRVNTFGGTIGVDLREYFPAQYTGVGVVQGQMLPTGRGFRLRPDEWLVLKAVSGDIDAALQSVIGAAPATNAVDE